MRRDGSTIALALLIIVLFGWTFFNRTRLFHHFDDNVAVTRAIDSSSFVIIDTSFIGLTIYYPPSDSIDLRCLEVPVPSADTNIVFCCAAAFTGKGEKGHGNIAGDHVSSGQRYSGYRCPRNTGAFICYDGQWEFLYKDYSHKLDSAAAHSGAGFAQEMMIHEGLQVETTRSLEDVNQFRALCMKGGKLCVVDANNAIPFGAFIKQLLDAGVEEAIYTDMGDGWNYSWYRKEPQDQAVFIHSEINVDATNWLVFYSSNGVIL